MFTVIHHHLIHRAFNFISKIFILISVDIKTNQSHITQLYQQNVYFYIKFLISLRQLPNKFFPGHLDGDVILGWYLSIPAPHFMS